MKDDLISRQAAIDALGEEPLVWHEDDAGEVAERNQWRRDVAAIKALPSAQLNLSEAYSKAVFTWLMDYQIRAAELKGRYMPYEVWSWVANDWRKEHERSD